MSGERKTGPAAGPPLYGAAATRLRSLGYKTAPWPSVEGPRALASEQVAAVNYVGVLILAPIDNPELRERVGNVLATRGLMAGPVRIGSDGCEVRPLRCTKLWRPSYAVLDAAVSLHETSLVPLDGSWPSGTLLEVAHDALPQVSNADDVPRLFDELQALPSTLAAERRPPPKPSRNAWVR